MLVSLSPLCLCLSCFTGHTHVFKNFLIYLCWNCLLSIYMLIVWNLFFFCLTFNAVPPVNTHTWGDKCWCTRTHKGQSVPHALSSPQSADSLFGLQDVVGTPGAALCGLTLNYKTISQKAFELLLLPLSPDCTPPDVREENLFVELPDFGCTRVSSIIDDMAAGDNHAAPLCW